MILNYQLWTYRRLLGLGERRLRSRRPVSAHTATARRRASLLEEQTQTHPQQQQQQQRECPAQVLAPWLQDQAQ